MKKLHLTKLYPLIKDALLAVLLVSATTFFLTIGNQNMIGEGVISLVFLLVVAWSAYRWGLMAGMSAALSAALMFNFFFIQPYYTFSIARPEGILILLIFVVVAVVIVERIQATLSKAQISEHEAMIMYEFSSLLAGMRSQEAIAINVARFIRQRYLAKLVIVLIQVKGQTTPTIAQEPKDEKPDTKPDCIIPILTAWGLAGEVQIWRSPEMELPSSESRLFRNIALQIGLAIERVQITEYELLRASGQEGAIA